MPAPPTHCDQLTECAELAGPDMRRNIRQAAFDYLRLPALSEPARTPRAPAASASGLLQSLGTVLGGRQLGLGAGWPSVHLRTQVRERDLFGRWTSRWRVIRTSNAYVLRDPKPQLAGVSACKSENPPGTQNQEILQLALASNPNSESALRQLGAGNEERLLLNGSSGQAGSLREKPVTGDRMPRVTELATEVAAKIRPLVMARFQQGRQWVERNPRTALLVGGVTVAVALLVLLITHWNPYKAQREAFTPLFTLTAGLAIAGVTLMRHFAQTEADRQRRITESFSKAIEQLGSDRLEVRLGGIYSLERISKESPGDYWTVMENLTAFVRERTRQTEEERLAEPLDQRLAKTAYFLWERHGRPEGHSEAFWAAAVREEPHWGSKPPPTDVATVLTVIKRRSADDRAREVRDNMVLDFQEAFLRHADLRSAHLEGADFFKTDLRHAGLMGAHLKGANFWFAHLERAGLRKANLEGADLTWAHLDGANLSETVLDGAVLFETKLERASLSLAHLKGTDLHGAHLEHADLRGAHLEDADLSRAIGLSQAQIDQAFGDAATKLPEELCRPAHWTNPDRRLPHNSPL